ncbi:TetR/AcrR family transcriptional regulator [Alteribacillus bidgolensis]|uniref:Transcriptional regulator, TetR family n=1 Tax=Alteribacillus bidgolensis TaxID=930129 RepID=A0A1G8CRY0_9BACI|nr:TetR/AcrR family transcriptional regulator [Alteribacillus bidgolensis]SDH48251.1 transcriptional regulator, TetR family [Alteribacillus bidgolensis]
MAEKMDRRKARTKKMLRAALLELMEEKGVKGVTVSELTSRADLNRGTFYLHFQDIDDYMEQSQDEFFQTLQDKMKEVNILEFNNAQDQPYSELISILEFIKNQADFLHVLFGPKGDPSFVVKWNSLCKNKCPISFLPYRLTKNKC